MNLTQRSLSKYIFVVFYTIILVTLLSDLLLHISQIRTTSDQTYFDSVLIILHVIALVGLLATPWRRRQYSYRDRPLQLASPVRNLADADARLQQIQRLAQVGDWRLEVATGITYWSEELFHVFGLELAAAPPTLEEFFRLIPPNERDDLRQTVEQSIRHGNSFKFDHGVCRPDGLQRYVTCQGEAIKNPAGDVVWLVGTARDITDYKRLELNLQASEARLNDVLNTAIAAIFSFRFYRDRTWEYVYASAGVEAIYGYAPADFLATPELWLTRVHPDDRESVIPDLLEQYLQAQRTQVEFRILNRQGDIRWLASSTVSHYSVDQDCWLVTVVDIDISDRKRAEIINQQAEIAARQQYALLRQVIDSIPHHIFAKDETGRFFLANQAAATAHGVTPEQLVGHREIDFNPYLDDMWLTQAMAVNREVMRRQQPQTLPDHQLLHHTGESRWYQMHLTPMSTSRGRCGASLATPWISMIANG